MSLDDGMDWTGHCRYKVCDHHYGGRMTPGCDDKHCVHHDDKEPGGVCSHCGELHTVTIRKPNALEQFNADGQRTTEPAEPLEPLFCEHQPYGEFTSDAYVVRCRRCPNVAAVHVPGGGPVLPPWAEVPVLPPYVLNP